MQQKIFDLINNQKSTSKELFDLITIGDEEYDTRMVEMVMSIRGSERLLRGMFDLAIMHEYYELALAIISENIENLYHSSCFTQINGENIFFRNPIVFSNSEVFLHVADDILVLVNDKFERNNQAVKIFKSQYDLKEGLDMFLPTKLCIEDLF